MSNKAMFEALDRTPQDLRHNTRIMGGATFLMAGDFRQTLPVVRASTRANEVNARIKHSYVWHSVISRHLQTNMRVHLRGDVESEAFAKQLLDLGDGVLPFVDDEHIRLPFGNFVPNVEELIRAVLPDVETNFQDLDWLRARAILWPHNTTADATNKQVLDMIPGEIVSFMSIDTNKDENDAVKYPPELLNKLTPPELPPHLLCLKCFPNILWNLMRNSSEKTHLLIEREHSCNCLINTIPSVS
ncbi:uncharacterized protein LOC115229720 [Octopus sinensis]|uniref:ATP-dependent DNA helicase n=1 Tax=Octopus sinensis TaxID=2607531 RepID=A0A6P7U0Y1_9MOLL|nr:uncharacterized protein LOC115229720 [Octopus sinensis]